MRQLMTILLIALLPLSAPAETPEEKGLAIIREADRRDTGWVDATAEMKMILRNQQGEASERMLRISNLEVEGDGDKSLSVFDAPKDIKGTALLSYTHALEPDDQWLYLPALKRVKRIASANKSGPFVGSEFAYEDLTSQEVEKYTYKWLREEAHEGRDAFVIEAYPAYENSGYTRQVVWLDKEMYRPVRIDYYDRKNALLKTFEASDWALYLERYWRPGRMNMVNHQTGKSTELLWSDYQFRTGLSERDFDQATLKRTR
ncbi:MAG: outer membrane lipoprotein-sorting protein [Gammaproteobacteria bacterium]